MDGSAGTADARAILESLLAPQTAAGFFARQYERQAAHFRAAAPREAPLSSARLLEALADGAASRSRLLLNPDAWGPDPESSFHSMPREQRLQRLHAYFEAGYPLILNGAHDLSPALTRICTALSQVFAAHVWPNVYATGTAGTPFDFHFDEHEVLALQCEGCKTWQISRLRVDRPLDVSGMREAREQALQQGRSASRSNLALEFTAEAGDVVYIPRGQFHNARTPAGRSLHVTFAIEPLSGYDFVQLLGDLALTDPVVRCFLPPPGLDGSETARAAYLDALRARLADLAAGERLKRELQRRLEMRCGHRGDAA